MWTFLAQNFKFEILDMGLWGFALEICVWNFEFGILGL